MSTAISFRGVFDSPFSDNKGYDKLYFEYFKVFFK